MSTLVSRLVPSFALNNESFVNQARRQRSWSVHELAERSGVPESRIRHYERENILPSGEDLKALARAFDTFHPAVKPKKTHKAIVSRPLKTFTPYEQREIKEFRARTDHLLALLFDEQRRIANLVASYHLV